MKSQTAILATPCTLLMIGALAVGVIAQTNGIRSQIDARNGEWMAAWNSGDLDALLAIYDEGFIAMPHMSEPITDRETLRGAFAGGLNQGGTMTLNTLSLKVHGGYAYEIGEATLSFETSDGSNQDSTSDYLVVWKKDTRGIWNYHVDIWWGNNSEE